MTFNIDHPSAVLNKELILSLRTASAEAELNGMLSKEQLDSIYAHKWFKLFAPKQFGGLELSLPEALRLEEALSWVDGSLAWVVTLCGGAGWFIGFLKNRQHLDLFESDKACIAGSGAVNGYADSTEGGFIINGSWPYASGALHATAFTANCFIRKENRLLCKEDGTAEVVSFILRSHEVTLKKTWSAMGMRATGSHAFEVSDLFVPSDRSFIIDPYHAVLNNPVYQYPFLQLAESTLAVNMSGMACRFLELVEHEVMQRKKQDLNILQSANDSLHQSRNKLFESVHQSWNALQTERIIPEDLLATVSRTSQDLVRVAKHCMTITYPHGGLKAAMTDTEMNRIWRNFFTAAQHTLFEK